MSVETVMVLRIPLCERSIPVGILKELHSGLLCVESDVFKDMVVYTHSPRT